MTKRNIRLYVEKKPGFQIEADDLLSNLRNNLKIELNNLRYLNIYDVFNIDEEVLPIAIKTVFSEVNVNDVYDCLPTNYSSLIAYEYLPGQYDQRADSATQCVKLLNPSSQCTIRSGTCLLFTDALNNNEIKAIEHYCINPIEARKKDLDILTLDENVEVTPMVDYANFINLSSKELAELLKQQGFAMSLDDLCFVQDYFKNSEKRNPTETEIRVLDTYWSDHCRHTTFETELEKITVNSKNFQQDIQNAYNRYLQMKQSVKRVDKPITLMEMATINSRYLKSTNRQLDVEISEEINACSIYIDVDVDGKMEKWLLMFKNETHNHPTEIEPFGGASTCIGGAIRDPLSGRSYVYQAMRIAGCGNVKETIEETIEGKLPQRVIAKKATHGNSSYGNQIGLPTTFAKEIYHPNYVAKHLELGAVVGAVPAENIIRETLTVGDVIILLGGKTGRDGIGGATGSSKEHNEKSLNTCASEVQKGNAPEERKIQRLFRNKAVTKLIKKCNDFGAGGVCVAIGELADGLQINLDEVKLKYLGLNATEIAISESQERMAVGVRKEDADKFIKYAEKENLLAYQVAVVTDDNRLVMKYKNEIVVNLDRNFINTNGVRQKVTVEINDGLTNNPLVDKKVSKEAINNMLGSLNCCCQKGMGEMFDASIGSTTVLMPYSGKYQLTPTQASVQKIPVLDGNTDTCSIMTYGFEPELMDYSAYLGAIYSILISMSKSIAVGGYLDKIHFSFQEYFKRLQKDPKRWGSVTQALLGSIEVQDFFNKGAIGGKDSMSGTFKNIDVPDTFVSFACSASNASRVIVPHFHNVGNKIMLYRPIIKENGKPDYQSYLDIYHDLQEKIDHKQVLASYVVENGGICEAVYKMAIGNGLGFKLNHKQQTLNLIPGAIIIETSEALIGNHLELIGEVSSTYQVEDILLDKEETDKIWLNGLTDLYPIYASNKNTEELVNVDCNQKADEYSTNCVDNVHVCIPVFPGTNCEYDIKRAFEDEGAVGEIVVFRNQNEKDVHDSIKELAACIANSQILAIPGGFSSGDEPDGSAKFIVNVLQNATIKQAINDLRARDGLILGICNGFQALIKSGLLPYGEIKELSVSDPTLYRNEINRHVSTIGYTRCASTKSPWLTSFNCGDEFSIAMSHGEGRFVADNETIQLLKQNGQIAFQYCDELGKVTNDPRYNINQSTQAIEGIISLDGHILGKMGHSERYREGLFINIAGNKKQNIFKNGVNYFRKR